MVNWKELGEVPDSEDEEDGFDTQASEDLPHLASMTMGDRADDTKKVQEKDIWDVPDSSQDIDPPISRPQAFPQALSRQHTPPPPPAIIIDSSPLSSLGTDPSSQSDRSTADDPDLPQTTAAGLDTNPSNVEQQQPTIQEEIWRSYEELASIPSGFEGGGEGPWSSAKLPQEKRTAPLRSQELGHDPEEHAALQAAVRYERSLRPRKPIQEHPYQLENARYSTFLKQHGVRPLRMAIEAERRRQQQASSQDHDFEDDSQESRLPEIPDESQLNGLEEFLDGLDNPEVPSPSPPKTSPMNDRAGPSSQASSATDNTSLAGDDLPNLADLLKQKPPRSLTKRRASPPRSSARKRRRYDVVDSDPFEPAARLRLGPGPADSPAAQRNSRRSPDPYDFEVDKAEPQPVQSHPPDRRASASPPPLTTPAVPLSMVMDDDSEDGIPPQNSHLGSEEGDSRSESGSDSGSEIVQKVGPRFRGVLPASYLRLDQQAGRDKIQKETSRRQADRSPEREQRRGVAQRRLGRTLSSTATQFIFDDSDEETPAPQQRTTDEVFYDQTRLFLREESDLPPIFDVESDDGASVVEDDPIDLMLPRRKRQLKLSESFKSTPKRSKLANTQPVPTSSRARQPRITSMFEGSTRTGPTPAAKRSVKKKYREGQSTIHRGKKNSKSHRPRKTQRPTTPPQLSILDVVEPDAPRFLKIAARAATRRREQGRSSPGRKVIRLATREDHVDAMLVLNSWRAGSIPQRQSVSAARKAKQPKPKPTNKPLSERSSNITPPQRRPPPSTTPLRKLVKHVSGGGTVSYQSKQTSRPSSNQQPRMNGRLSRASSGVARPAQLEMDETEHVSKYAFNATKRRLDRIFRKQHGDLSTSTLLDLQDNRPDTMFSASPPPEDNPVPLRIVPDIREDQRKSRYRKQTRPRKVDAEAPQYTCVNDPITVQAPLVPVMEPVQPETEGKKLRGLGPYGTQYTHHFEIRTLDCRVYFHESTLIGSCALEAISSSDYCKRLFNLRPRTSFAFGDQTLRWGPWDAQVSSELGVVLDSMAEQLERSSSDHSFDPGSALQAATFIMKYTMDALSLTDPASAKSYASRMLEALKGFDGRVKVLLGQNSHFQQSRCSLIASIYNHLLIVALLILRLCQDNTSLMAEQFQMEDLLKGLARTSISSLLTIGLDQVRKTYEDLHTTRFREQGIRDDTPTLHSWLTAMKVLEHAQILRASFWDITYTVMAAPEAVASLDAQEQETLWKNMFTLLPLTEFNDKGMIIPGKRHDTVVDGWALPQKLLKKVFQLYQDNPRQPPSFNNYCRALVARCHYLVQQWGWRKSAAVVGVIFDFFGSQNFAHLRNEEVYKSPRFLEELAANQSLDVEPEDRCFHVFLKLIAVSIKKLRVVGSLNDIRNLVARTMPNHNRQLLKEQTIHERDLAALRNHHDLLCTLFWASPPELRPGAHIIERLVVPASSHKEACLINLRAWNQLARFIIASGEATTSFKPFAQWRNTFFQQMMQQFDSVEQDMQQQFLSLSKDAVGSITNAMFDAMVASNRAAVMDVLYFSIRASLDVMRHAPNLEAATYALNALQLQQVFKHFAVCPPQLDWGVLQAALTTLEIFLSKVDEFIDEEESQQSESQLLNSAQADDAIMMVEQDISKTFFSMARCVVSSRGNRELPTSLEIDKANCTEKVVVLSARLGVRFINGGLLRLSDMFKHGKYGLFDGMPANLSLENRKFLVLFVNTLFKHGFDDFSDAGFTLSELWTLSIVKPRQYLAYEYQLAEQLRNYQKDFVPEGVTGLASNPDYNTNRDLFEFAISWMRKSLRDAGPTLKKILLSEHSKTLKTVMQQIKGDLGAIVNDATGHPSYVAFIRDIIGLIRAHGSEICTVDDFFYQINKEYSPSMQDPQLQVAGMMSYGMRLSEGDTKVIHQLFFFLFNNFKMSLINYKLGDEVNMLRKGLSNPGIRSFFLGKMLPAIIRASFLDSAAFPLVDLYVAALHLFLSQPVVPYEMAEEDLPGLLVTLKALLRGMGQIYEGGSVLTLPQVHLMRQMVALLNELWPSFLVLSLSEDSPPAWDGIMQVMRSLRSGLDPAESHMDDLIEIEDFTLDSSSLLSGLQTPPDTSRADPHVTSFTDNIVNDVQRNWLVTANKITIQAPGKGRGVPSTQSGQGTDRPTWDARELVLDLNFFNPQFLYDELELFENYFQAHEPSCATRHLLHRKRPSLTTMAHSRPLFKHQPLADTNNIRIIKLFPSRETNSSIIIGLTEVELSSSPAYEALSYTWDDQKPTEDITCNGTTLRVTENVFLALRRLRRNDIRHRMLWIDAICVNQSDRTEKAAQVSIMGDIFTSAQMVNIWLSQSTEAMQLAFEGIRHANDEKWWESHESHTFTPTLKDGFVQLMSHRYWARAWTTQEAALNQNSCIYIGQLEPIDISPFDILSWTVECRLHDVSTQPNPEDLYMDKLEDFYADIPEDLYGGMTRGSVPHYTLFNPFRINLLNANKAFIRQLVEKKAQNPLDNIFALRSFFPPFAEIKVDYKRDLVDVLREATVRIIPHITLGALFELVSLCPAVPNAPSWILNLSCGKHLDWNSQFLGEWRMGIADIKNPGSLFSDKTSLSVTGLLVDHVYIISEEFPHYALEDQAKWHNEVHAILTRWRIRTRPFLKKKFVEALVDILMAETCETKWKVTFGHRSTPKQKELELEKGIECKQLSAWLNDPGIPYRLDRDGILRSTRSESRFSPAIHSPALGGRNLFITSKGKMGLTRKVKVGDTIAVIYGCEVPYALRAVPRTNKYTLGQPVMLPGNMSGEGWPTEGKPGLRKIVIV
ncbi:Fc.00g031210.m01.CDS01 [Cosmosporella sp. VM-42]